MMRALTNISDPELLHSQVKTHIFNLHIASLKRFALQIFALLLGGQQRYQMNSCIRLEAETPRGQAFESAEVQKSVREFSHGLNFSKPLHRN